jgi:hypothetical protein
MIVSLGCDCFPLLCHVHWNELRLSVFALFGMSVCAIPSESVWSGLSPLLRSLLLPLALFDSLIVSEFPGLLAEFDGKGFPLLWRGSRDGFGAKDFHDRCDGHANTLTLIEDTSGNIFGGFTPVKWESRRGYFSQCAAADRSCKSFLFTLKNPHNFPARKFALHAYQQDGAICCCSFFGPVFGGGAGGGIAVFDNCDRRADNDTRLGYRYANATGVNGRTVFTGSRQFTVKEIEVFEITD